MPTRDLILALKSKFDDSGTTNAQKGLKQAEDASKRFTRELENLEKQAKQQGTTLTKAAADAGRFGDQLDDVGRTAIKTRRLLEDATRRLPEIEITADSSDAEREVADLKKRLSELSGKRIGIDLDARAAADEAEKIRRQLTALAAMHPEVLVGANVDRAVRDLDRVEREARDLDRRVTVDVNVDGAAAATAGLGLVQSALTLIRSTGPTTWAAVAAGMVSLPALSAGVAGAVTVVLGGALAGIGLAAAHGSDAAQDAIGQLRATAEREAAVMGQPFEAVWTRIVQVAERELAELSPVIRRNLDDLAPVVEDFVDDAGDSLDELTPAIDAVQRAFAAVLADLGPKMPQIMQHLANAISAVVGAIERDPALVSDFAVNLAKIAEWAGNAVASLAKLVRTVQENANAFKAIATVVNPAAGVLSHFGVEAAKVERQNIAMGQSSGPAASGLMSIAASADEASGTMRTAWADAYASFVDLAGVMASAQQRTSGVNTMAQAQARAAEAARQGAERIARAERDLADTQEQSAERVAAAKQRVKDAHRQAAEAVEAAQERVRDAQAAVTAAVEQGAEREAAAQRRVEDARRRLADVAEDGARRIADAQQRLADAQQDAAARQVDAERRVQDAHRRTQEAVEDLTAARERAAERIEDLIAAESGAALDEEGAQLAIDRARQRLDEIGSDPEATDLDRREADLAYRQALARLEEVRRRNAELREDLADAQRRGIDGSTEVVDAIGRIEDARRAESEAEEAAARQREENARTVADAERAVSDAHAEAARQREDAARQLADAESELDRTRVENARAVREAQQDVAAAQKDAAQVAKDAARQVSEAQAEAAKASRDAARDVQDAERAVREARQEAARDAAAAVDNVTGSYGRLRGEAKLTSEELLRELEKQVRDQEAWQDNLIKLSARVPPAMLDELAKLGPGAANIVAAAADMSDEELSKFISLHGRSGKEAGEVFAQNLQDAGPALRHIAQTRGQEVADKVREGMDGGRRSVFESAQKLGIEIDNGIGKDRTVRVFVKTEYQDDLSREALRAAVGMADGGILTYANGGIRSFAGGAENHIAQIASANTIRMWAEPETGGEAYIPLAMSKRARSEDILSEVAERFGGRFFKTMPVSRTPASAGGSSGGMYRPAPVYNISVNGGLDSGPEIGRRVVSAIQEFERRSGAGWRRST
ncbi:hypothetical protein AB0I81_23010 [Nonomuraea sp. NPDC050404]|uniref:hypothetical protein n=1 Tax=Nonomuraea sp. NPDC050404 TaxID=3155783 RepID=UPI0033EF035F